MREIAIVLLSVAWGSNAWAQSVSDCSTLGVGDPPPNPAYAARTCDSRCVADGVGGVDCTMEALANPLVGDPFVTAVAGPAGDERYFVWGNAKGSGADPTLMSNLPYCCVLEADGALEVSRISVFGTEEDDEMLFVCNHPKENNFCTSNLQLEPAVAGVALTARMFGGASGDWMYSSPRDADATYDERLFGQDGRDRMYGNVGADELHGGPKNDTMFGNDGSDLLFGDDGNDYVAGGEGDDTLFGGAGKDRLLGGRGVGEDVLCGEDGNDRLEGGDGSDVLIGGAGKDTLRGEDDGDILVGEAGDDVLEGGDGNDVLLGGDGADLLDGAGGPDDFLDVSSVDEVQGGEGKDVACTKEFGLVTPSGDMDGLPTEIDTCQDDVVLAGCDATSTTCPVAPVDPATLLLCQ